MLEIKDIKVEELIPYAKNARINDKSVEKVRASIEQFGFKVPLVIDSNYTIITGHTRLKAALQLGLKEVPCIVANDLTPEQVKAFRLADNKVSEFSQWDFKLLADELTEITDFDMGEFGFVNMGEIDWENVEEITPANYEKPKKEQLQCPKCNHIDAKVRFKKITD